MKFTSSTFFVSLLSISTATAVQVFPDFLSSEDVERYRQEAASRNRPASSGPSGYRRKLSPVTLKGDLYNMIRTALGKDEATADPLETEAHVTTFKGSSKSHIDYYQDGEFNVPVEEQVGFVFLTEEKDAYFRHGDDVKVPAQKGTLVTYEGDVVHQTVIPRGKTLQILGPFAISTESLNSVGPSKKKIPTRKLKMGKSKHGSSGYGYAQQNQIRAPSPTISLDGPGCACLVKGGQLQCNSNCGNGADPIVPAPAPKPEDGGQATQLDLGPAPKPKGPMAMDWEMRGGTGACSCTVLTSNSGYCTGDCGN